MYMVYLIHLKIWIVYTLQDLKTTTSKCQDFNLPFLNSFNASCRIFWWSISKSNCFLIMCSLSSKSPKWAKAHSLNLFKVFFEHIWYSPVVNHFFFFNIFWSLLLSSQSHSFLISVGESMFTYLIYFYLICENVIYIYMPRNRHPVSCIMILYFIKSEACIWLFI